MKTWHHYLKSSAVTFLLITRVYYMCIIIAYSYYWRCSIVFVVIWQIFAMSRFWVSPPLMPLGLCPVNERLCYFATRSLIGWMQALYPQLFIDCGMNNMDDIFKWIFLNGNFRTSNKISLKYILKGLIDNKSALVQPMAWRHTGDKPLSEPMLRGSGYGKYLPVRYRYHL